MNVEGVDKLFRKLQRVGKLIEDDIEAVTEATAYEISNKASSLAPNGGVHSGVTGTYRGTLKGSMYTEKLSKMEYAIGSKASYAPYVEFGTGSRVQVPKGWEDLAWSYYVNGKGYMYPQPFLYPAWYSGQREYKRKLQLLLDKYSA